MTTKGKSMCITEFFSNRTDWDGWSEKLLVQATHNGYKNLLMGKVGWVEVDKIPNKDE